MVTATPFYGIFTTLHLINNFDAFDILKNASNPCAHQFVVIYKKNANQREFSKNKGRHTVVFFIRLLSGIEFSCKQSAKTAKGTEQYISKKRVYSVRSNAYQVKPESKNMTAEIKK